MEWTRISVHSKGKYIVLHIRYISLTIYNVFKICNSNGYVSIGHLAIRMLFKTKKLCLRMLVHARTKKLLLQTSWYLFKITYKFCSKYTATLFITSSLLSEVVLDKKQQKVLIHAIRVLQVVRWF